MVKDNLAIPAGLADRWETIVSEASKHAYESRQQMKEAVGFRPYRGMPVDPAELEAQFMQVRSDPQALAELIRQNTTVKPDGNILIRKGFLEGMRSQEQKIRKGSMIDGV
jgi:hypothetical protein